jgi:hypothetical protein
VRDLQLGLDNAVVVIDGMTKCEKLRVEEKYSTTTGY